MRSSERIVLTRPNILAVRLGPAGSGLGPAGTGLRLAGQRGKGRKKRVGRPCKKVGRKKKVGRPRKKK